MDRAWAIQGLDFEDPVEVADMLWRFACAMDGDGLEGRQSL
jgi:hypothetical protein